MNLRSLDLNLLVVFDAVARTRSTTQAAAALNMSQPAVSHALGRLRGALKDELFVRTPDGMEPTPYAVHLADRVREAIETLRPALQGKTAFEPGSAEQRFTVAADNRAALTLTAPLAAAVAVEAPGVTLGVVPSGTLDIGRRLDHGDLDLALGSPAEPGERFVDHPLFECGFAALVRRGHPAARKLALGLADLARHPHLTLSSTGEGTEFVDAAMARGGLRRRIACTGPLLAAPAMLLGSDLIAIMGARGARAFARTAPLAVLDLAFETPRLLTAMRWHRRLDGLAAHRWLRSVVLRVARDL